jgi:Tfp pilus assembly protein PilF
VLEFQQQAASELATALTRQITGSSPQIEFPSRAVDRRAREAYLAGRFYWNQRDLLGLQKAIASYEEAIAIDPKYVPAWAGLAESYDLMTDRGVLTNDEAFGRAKQAANTALSLDPGSAEAYNALAFAIYRQDWNFARAEACFKKAIELNPNFAVGHQWYGEFLGDLRRFDQSIAELRRAEELDPLSPMVGSDLADGYMHAGRVNEAEAELKRVIDLYPDFPPAHVYRIGVYSVQGKWNEARAEAEAYFEHTGDRSQLEEVEIHQMASAGKMEAARSQMLSYVRTAKDKPFSAYRMAQLYFATGQQEQGYDALESAFREHSWWLATMLVDPGFVSVRSQTQFLDLARRVGLPSASIDLRAPALGR